VHGSMWLCGQVSVRLHPYLSHVYGWDDIVVGVDHSIDNGDNGGINSVDDADNNGINNNSVDDADDNGIGDDDACDNDNKSDAGSNHGRAGLLSASRRHGHRWKVCELLSGGNVGRLFAEPILPGRLLYGSERWGDLLRECCLLRHYVRFDGIQRHVRDVRNDDVDVDNDDGIDNNINHGIHCDYFDADYDEHGAADNNEHVAADNNHGLL